jgi:hypothetical protein
MPLSAHPLSVLPLELVMSEPLSVHQSSVLPLELSSVLPLELALLAPASKGPELALMSNTVGPASAMFDNRCPRQRPKSRWYIHGKSKYCSRTRRNYNRTK